jgi:epoxide hydrolase-like predicted phosphatase
VTRSRALLLDYGGVLTPSVGRQFRDFERAHDLPKGTVFDVVRAAYGSGGDDSDIARLERGELDTAVFEQRLAATFAAHGHRLPAAGLVADLFGHVQPAGRLWDATRRLRDAGVVTGVLSNSWGEGIYPDAGLMDRHFDDVVISAQVGMRKPEPRIFELAAGRLGVPVDACVFVDDLDRNVEVARALGMVGVHHDGDEDRVLAALSRAFACDVTVAADWSG